MIFRKLINLIIFVGLFMAIATAITPNVRIYNLENWVEPEKNKKAKAESFGPGTYNFVKDKKHKDWNNRITSVRVPKGWAVTFFEHQMKGQTKTYLKDEDKLGKHLNNEVSAMVVTAPAENIDASRVYIVGTNKSYSKAQLKSELASGGRKLVNKDKLGLNECTVSYPDITRKGISAGMGGLICAVETKIGGVEISLIPVYGGCQMNASQGAGAACEIGIFKADVTVEIPGGFKNTYTLKGPNAQGCAALSKQMTCMNAGAELVSTSTELTDKHGNAIGAGVSVGVGAGLDAQMKGWTLSASIDLQLGIGAKVNFSVNFEKDGKAIYKVTKAGYAKVGGKIEGAGARALAAFPKDQALKKTKVMGKAVLGTWKKGGDTVIKASKKAGSTIASLGKSDTWDDVGDVFEDVGGEIGDWFGL